MLKNAAPAIRRFQRAKMTLFSHLQQWWRHLNAIFLRAERHHLFLLASGISYDAFLFSLPTLLVMVLLVGLFTDAHSIVQTLADLLQQVFPPEQWSQSFVTETTQQLQWILDKALALGWISIPAVFWLGSTLFGSIRTALNAIFELKEPGFFLKYKLKDIGILLFFTLLVMLVGIFNTSTTVLEIFLSTYFPKISTLWLWARNLLSLCITAVFFYFLYLLPPHGTLPSYVVRFSTILSTILWESAKYLFAWYISNISSYGTIYGTYAVIVVSALWMYYTWMIFLLSAEIARYFYESRLTRAAASTINPASDDET